MIFVKSRPRGFTIIEMSVATGLMALLALVLSFGWQSLGRATVDLIARTQIAQEMDFTVAALSHDLGGCVVNAEGQTATTSFPITSDNAVTVFQAPPSSGTVSASDGTQIPIKWTLDNGDRVEYDIETSPETSTTEWKHNLVRNYYNKKDDKTTKFTVAKNVDSVETCWDSNKNLVIKVVFSCNYHVLTGGKQDRTQSIIKRSCKLVTNMPSPREI
jgi:prepilin-type N-terminal cleavage/methylation domain-containing protein